MTRPDFDPEDLERRIGEALRGLPEPHAPRTLAPRVMAAVAARAHRPWYTREWAAWPGGWQMASALLLMVTLSAVLVATPYALNAARAVVVAVATDAGARVTGDAVLASGLVQAAHVLAGAVVLVVGRVLPLVLVMYVMCLLLGAALKRVALGEAAS